MKKSPPLQKQNEEDFLFIEETQKVPSGIPGFDDLSSGGFEKNSCNLIVGPSGAGKSIFLSQFIYSGAVFYDEPGVIVNLDRKKEIEYSHLAKFNWLFAELEKKGLISFINIKPHELKKLIEEGGGFIWDSVMDIGAKRFVIDSLSSFSIYFQSYYELRESIINLFELTKKWKCTSLFSYHTSDYSKLKFEFNLEFLADSLIGLYIFRKDNVRIRGIEIIKMLGSQHSQKLAPFEIVEGEGIVIYPSENIFEI
ncbi:MAG: ATPase domain-containing protein [Candidatus Anstonellaceae archaeon]